MYCFTDRVLRWRLTLEGCGLAALCLEKQSAPSITAGFSRDNFERYAALTLAARMGSRRYGGMDKGEGENYQVAWTAPAWKICRRGQGPWASNC